MPDQEELRRYAAELESPVWRLSSKSHDPMTPAPRRYQGGSRFDDSAIGSPDDAEGFSVLYCAPSAKAVFLELLAGLRPEIDELRSLIRPVLAEVAERDIFSGTSIGVISKEWRDTWQLSVAKISLRYPVFDLTNPAAVQMIREQLAGVIYALGINDVDFGVVLGNDRRLTQAVSRWIWSMRDDDGQPLFSGIRYRSRFDPDRICLALYSDRFAVDGDFNTQPITLETPGFAEAASILRLQIS